MAVDAGNNLAKARDIFAAHQASPTHQIDHSPAHARAATAIVLKSRRLTTEIQFVTSIGDPRRLLDHLVGACH
jgi:hypothetical protein